MSIFFRVFSLFSCNVHKCYRYFFFFPRNLNSQCSAWEKLYFVFLIVSFLMEDIFILFYLFFTHVSFSFIFKSFVAVLFLKSFFPRKDSATDNSATQYYLEANASYIVFLKKLRMFQTTL